MKIEKNFTLCSAHEIINMLQISFMEDACVSDVNANQFILNSGISLSNIFPIPSKLWNNTYSNTVDSLEHVVDWIRFFFDDTYVVKFNQESSKKNACINHRYCSERLIVLHEKEKLYMFSCINQSIKFSVMSLSSKYFFICDVTPLLNREHSTFSFSSNKKISSSCYKGPVKANKVKLTSDGFLYSFYQYSQNAFEDLRQCDMEALVAKLNNAFCHLTDFESSSTLRHNYSKMFSELESVIFYQANNVSS